MPASLLWHLYKEFEKKKKKKKTVSLSTAKQLAKLVYCSSLIFCYALHFQLFSKINAVVV